jgi:hypothetical protein
MCACVGHLGYRKIVMHASNLFSKAMSTLFSHVLECNDTLNINALARPKKGSILKVLMTNFDTFCMLNYN